MAGHVYGISIGAGKTIDFQQVCRNCGLTMGSSPSQFENAAPNLPESLPELIRATYPNIHSREGERLSIEERVQHDPRSLPPSLRFSLLKEPFVMVAYHQTRGERDMSPRAALTLLAAFVLPLLVAAATSATPDLATILTIVTFVCGFGYALRVGSTELRKHRARSPEALLSRALIPLKPSREELAGVLNDPEVRGLPVWRRYSPEKIIRTMLVDVVTLANAPTTSKRPTARDV